MSFLFTSTGNGNGVVREDGEGKGKGRRMKENTKNSAKMLIFGLMMMTLGLPLRAIHFSDLFHGNVSVIDCTPPS